MRRTAEGALMWEYLRTHLRSLAIKGVRIRTADSEFTLVQALPESDWRPVKDCG